MKPLYRLLGVNERLIIVGSINDQYRGGASVEACADRFNLTAAAARVLLGLPHGITDSDVLVQDVALPLYPILERGELAGVLGTDREKLRRLLRNTFRIPLRQAQLYPTTPPEHFSGRFLVSPDLIKLPLRGGPSVLIDRDSWSAISRFSWVRCEEHEGGLRRVYALAREPGTYRTLRMHRLIVPTEAGLYLDHINGDGLDNRVANLRVATNSQNQMNRRPNHDHKYKGVSRVRGKFKAQLKFGGRHVCLGSYRTEEDAALAYDRGAAQYFGEFARLNFPEARDVKAA